MLGILILFKINFRLFIINKSVITWKKPGDTGRYQIDYILVKQRYRNSVKNSRGYPEADADTDHVLVKMNIKITLKRFKGKKMQDIHESR